MSDVSISPDSFLFGGIDMYQKYGLRIVHYDVLTPKLRPRKVVIPLRSGAYDYGARYYDERQIRIECDTRNALSRAQLRELAYDLSSKNVLRLWDEPDKYYIGRIYDPAEIKSEGEVVDYFTLLFICEPFAYGEIMDISFSHHLTPEYRGTASTPTRIEITNAGTGDAVGIKIVLTERKETY